MIEYTSMSIVFYYVLLLIWYTSTLFLSYPEIMNMHDETCYGHIDHLMQNSTIPVSVIIAAFNEEQRILNTIYSVLNNQYKNVTIYIVNDGSTDGTLSLLKSELSLYEIPPVINQQLVTSQLRHYYQSKRYNNIFVIDKERGPFNNPADSHNLSLNAISSPVVMTIDADTVLEADAIETALYNLLSNCHCVAVGGSIYILNENSVAHGRMLTRNMPKKFILALQCIEYLRSFTYGRAGLNRLSGSLCYPGAFTLFETQAIKEFGGFDRKNCSFDAEITLKFHHRMRKVKYPTFLRFSANAIGWTVVPDNLRSYWRQRNFWQRGMLLSAVKHMGMFFNPRYGIVGMITFPAFVLFEVFGPVVEFFSYLFFGISLVLGVINWSEIGWYLLWAWGSLLLLTMGSLYLSLMTISVFNRFSDTLRVLWYVTLEMFWFRQFKAVCCSWATLQFIWNRSGKRAAN